ncbi:hypothetical protein FDP41_005138 [Naegleria fowleri]|uniref:Uncharacterized protein n=1 Tax=Naegleria fowleri TaxID=5763 RepID=A0A6A5BNF6_NAEFO|nr:uncharacterized protein FDP41_005138 [Naegleria fowleri]KAF0975811.1 hypothetical protein FDP41_005138 [Naegleria fowleri]CAG4719088.1 unnamed protein product [Naegleria fowleri]
MSWIPDEYKSLKQHQQQEQYTTLKDEDIREHSTSAEQRGEQKVESSPSSNRKDFESTIESTNKPKIGDPNYPFAK